MAYQKKTWQDRVVEYPNRRDLTDGNNTVSTYTVSRNEGEITVEGDAFNAANMNGLEGRIEDGFADVETEVAAMTLAVASWSNGTYTIQDNRIHVDAGRETTQEILPDRSINANQLKAWNKALIIDYLQSENQIVIKALGTVPTVAIPIRIIFHGYY